MDGGPGRGGACQMGQARGRLGGGKSVLGGCGGALNPTEAPGTPTPGILVSPHHSRAQGASTPTSGPKCMVNRHPASAGFQRRESTRSILMPRKTTPTSKAIITSHTNRPTIIDSTQNTAITAATPAAIRIFMTCPSQG